MSLELLPLDISREPLHRPRVRLFFLSLVLLLPACSQARTAVSVDVTAGQETAAFGEAPAVTTFAVTVTSLDGAIDVTATGAPGQTFDFGDFDDFEQITVTLDGSAESGQVMGGQTLTGLLLSTILGDIPVFAQRRGQWSRPSGGFAASHVNGVVTVIDGSLPDDPRRHGGDEGHRRRPPGTSMRSICSASPATQRSPVFVPVPLTIVPVPASSNNPDTQALFLSAGSPELYDYTQGADNTDNAPLTMPTGITSWTDVTGGAVLSDGNGRAFVVGATRSGGATTAVLDVEVDADGDVVLTDFPLNVARAGAAAAYIADVGLVVAGGSSSLAGVEVLSPTATAFAPQGNSPPIRWPAPRRSPTESRGGVGLVGGVQTGGAIGPRVQVALSTCTMGCMAAAIAALAVPGGAGERVGLPDWRDLLAVGNQVRRGLQPELHRRRRHADRHGGAPARAAQGGLCHRGAERHARCPRGGARGRDAGAVGGAVLAVAPRARRKRKTAELRVGPRGAQKMAPRPTSYQH